MPLNVEYFFILNLLEVSDFSLKSNVH